MTAAAAMPSDLGLLILVVLAVWLAGMSVVLLIVKAR